MIEQRTATALLHKRVVAILITVQEMPMLSLIIRRHRNENE